MALLDVDLDLRVRTTVAALPMPERLAALRGIDPGMADLVEGFANAGVTRRYTVESIAEAVHLLSDVATLTAALDHETRGRARSEIRSRIRALRSSRPGDERNIAAHIDALLHRTPAYEAFRAAVRAVRTHPGRYDPSAVLAAYERQAGNPAARALIAVAVAPVCDDAVVARFVADMAAGTTGPPSGTSDLERLLGALRTPADAMICEWLVDRSTNSKPARQALRRLGATPEGLDVLWGADRLDLVLAAGVPASEVVDRALIGPAQSWPRLLEAAGAEDVVTLARPILAAAIASGIDPEAHRGPWPGAARKVLELLHGSGERNVALAALHLVTGNGFTNALTDPAWRWTPDEIEGLVTSMCVHGSCTTVAELVDFLASPDGSVFGPRVIDALFTHCPGLLGQWRAYGAEAAELVAGFLAPRLGTDPRRWSLFFQLWESFTGTPTELVAAVDATLASPVT